MDKKVQDILSKMTLEDKISLCNGADFWHSKAMAQYGIPTVTMSDGPHGVRCQKNSADMLGVNESEPATCFPTAVTSGATWDTALLKAEGQAIGEGKVRENAAICNPEERKTTIWTGKVIELNSYYLLPSALFLSYGLDC